MFKNLIPQSIKISLISIIGTLTALFSIFVFNDVASAQTVVPVQAWVARYNGLISGTNWGEKVITDTIGNVYAIGYGSNGTNYDYAVIKYDTNGNQLWVRRYDSGGDDMIPRRSLVVDSAGNIYVTGGACVPYEDSITAGWCSKSDYITIKYDTDGNQLWVRRYDGGKGDVAKGLVL